MEPTPTDTDAAAAMVAEAIAATSTVLEPIAEAVQGYAAARQAEGFSEQQARSMATDYHTVLCRTMLLGM